MDALRHQCATCRVWLEAPLAGAAAAVRCPHCGVEVRAHVFPALLRPAAGGAGGEPVASPEESSCFYHPDKRAQTACEACGRFLCALCDVEAYGRHLCPVCIEKGLDKGTLADTQRERMRYDSIALAVAVLPVLCIWPSLVGAPVALYLTFRYWRTPLSLAPYNRWRFVVAALISAVTLGFWIVGIGASMGM